MAPKSLWFGISLMGQTIAISTSPSELIAGSNEFGYNLLSNLDEDKSSNEWISPFCISSCFSLIYPGSGGKTKSQIAHVMGYPKDGEVTSQFFDLQSIIESTYDGKGESEWQKKSIIGIANKIFASKKLVLKQSYVDTLSGGNKPFIESIDFTANNAAKTINLWVNESTNGLIDSIIDDNEDKSEWRLVAMNAIYLNGTFRSKFDDYMTSSNAFYSDVSRTNKVSDCHLMHQTDYFDYYQDGQYQILKFSFSDSANLFLLFALPLTNDADEYPVIVDKVLSKMERTYVALALPKLSIEASYSLKEPLIEMGMVDAFGQNAEFDGISSNQRLYIDKVIHKTMVEMDENGLVAAAVTAIVISDMAMMENPDPDPILFKADHSFKLFIIDGEHDNTILFMGNIRKPGIPNGSKTPTFDEKVDPVWNNFSTASDVNRGKMQIPRDEMSKSNSISTMIAAIICIIATMAIWHYVVVR